LKIVLLADHRKNELLVNFCIAFMRILEKHELVSVSNTARLVRSASNLDVLGLSADNSGGLEPLASRAMFNEIDAVVYLRDPMLDEYDLPNPLTRACDVNSIPYATNLATAEILVLAIDRGDLDWRKLLR
jgi:methylglyoxal synthase